MGKAKSKNAETVKGEGERKSKGKDAADYEGKHPGKNEVKNEVQEDDKDDCKNEGKV